MTKYKIAIIIISFITLSISKSFGQNKLISVSGTIKDKTAKTVLPYVNVILKTVKDTLFVTGTVSNEEGRFTLSNIKPNDYFWALLKF